jgi:hypothetical protein
MVGAEDETGSFAPEELPNRLDFLQHRILIRDHVVQPKHHHGIGVCQDTLVERQLESSLIDSLKHRDGVPRGFQNKLLKRRPGPEEQFQRSGNPLLKLKGIGPLRRLIVRPRHPPNLSHR